MVPVLIEETVIVLITIYPQSWTAVVSLVSKIGIIEVRTVRSSKTFPDNDARVHNLYLHELPLTCEWSQRYHCLSVTHEADHTPCISEELCPCLWMHIGTTSKDKLVFTQF